jgi:hypothetical protein
MLSHCHPHKKELGGSVYIKLIEIRYVAGG